MELVFPAANLSDPSTMNWYRVAAIALAMGLIGGAMIGLRCVHPPAAASALIGAMGYLGNFTQIVGLPLAVVLLILEAYLFNRLLGGLPYPFWKADPRISRMYGSLAGIPDDHTFWSQLTSKIFQRR
jgi:CBS-domain-containing membrane protein